MVLRHFTVFFDNDKYVRYEGDPLPTEAEFIATAIRLNTEEAKASGVGSTTAVVPNVRHRPTRPQLQRRMAQRPR